jgi:membrane protein DedA with SNARE-associated domain
VHSSALRVDHALRWISGIRRQVQAALGSHELEWADRFFSRWGYLAVFFARMLPVIRTFIALPAGIARMPRARFHVYTFLGSWPWCFALAYFGMKLGQNWRELGKYFHQFDAVIVAVLVAGAVWFVWSHWQNRISSQPSSSMADQQ